MSEYTRKPRSSRHNKKHMPRVLLVVCLMLVVMVGSIAGTVAWLTDKTDEVKNTFTTAGIDITLTETFNAKSSPDKEENDTWTMQMIPGTSATKNPVVTVVRPETDVDIYLFVKFEETVDENVVTYTSNLTEANGWHALTEVDGVWYREVGKADKDVSWHLLKDDTVSVASTVTKDKIPSETGTMKFTAYAIQKEGFSTAALAWNEVSK